MFFRTLIRIIFWPALALMSAKKRLKQIDDETFSDFIVLGLLQIGIIIYSAFALVLYEGIKIKIIWATALSISLIFYVIGAKKFLSRHQ